jgi:hypothetical protein
MRIHLMGLVLWVALLGAPIHAEGEAVKVYKSPTCGCCGKWVEHLESHGFEVEAVNTTALDALKDDNAIPRELRSCHTAFVEGYVIEGHVPAEDVKRLLTERPELAGLAVPDMPIGSPGMEAHPGGKGPVAESYDVVGFGGKNGTVVFASHEPMEAEGEGHKAH